MCLCVTLEELRQDIHVVILSLFYFFNLNFLFTQPDTFFITCVFKAADSTNAHGE